MKKRTKKNIKYISIFLGVILLIGVIYYFAVPQNILGDNTDTRITNTQITNEYINFDLGWSEPNSHISIKCGDIRDVNGNLRWNTQNIGKSLGYLIETVKPITSGNAPSEMSDSVKELDGLEGKILSAEFNGKEIINIDGTCELEVVSKWGNPYDNSQGQQMVDRLWYVHPTNCKFIGQIDLTDNSGCSQYDEGMYMVSTNNGKLSVTFYKEGFEPIVVIEEISDTMEETTETDTTQEETKECIDNNDCIEICGDKTLTCENNICLCDDKVYEIDTSGSGSSSSSDSTDTGKSKSDLNPLYYLVPVIVLILIGYITIKLVRKPKRKGR